MAPERSILFLRSLTICAPVSGEESPMRSIGRWSALVGAFTLAACAESAPVNAVDAARLDAAVLADAGAARLDVLTRNLYIGADLNPAIAALATETLADDIPAIIGTVNEINAADWPTRVGALAAEIVRTRPQVIGLQEVWTVNVNLNPINVPVSLHLDFLEDLMDALAAAGMPYAVAAAVTSIDAQPNALVGVTDRDVILVDTERVTVTPGSVELHNFSANLGEVAPKVALLRGWATIHATVDGMPMWITSTHLESGRNPGLPALRAAQVYELVSSLGTRSPAVLLGDLNDDEGSPMYGVVTGAGFRDAWREMRPGVAGLTCCHVEDLSNASAIGTFDQRIDYVFTRGLEFENHAMLGSVQVLGANASERVAGRLWPSDHAGVLASLLLPPTP